MLKLKASFSKKDFNGNLYSSAVELELPDGLSGEQIIEKDHEAFSLLKKAVDEEIGISNPPQAPQQIQHQSFIQPGFTGQNSQSQVHPDPGQSNMATPKQLKLLFDLGSRNGVMINDIVRTRFNVHNANQLSKSQCAMMIDEFKAGSNNQAA